MAFIFFFFIFLNQHSLNYPISFLKIINKTSPELKNYFWYFDFFNFQDFYSLTGKGIHIVIIDGDIVFSDSQIGKKAFISINISHAQRKLISSKIHESMQNLSLCAMQKKFTLKKIIQKNHAQITVDLITQIAAAAKITVIPVLDQQGSASKSDLYQGLQKALTMNPDILHLGLQIMDFNSKFALDKKILKILKKFKCIVAPSGNNGKDKKVGFPANCSFVISVGSFKQDNLVLSSWPETVEQGYASKDFGEIDRYKVSDFCQTKGGVDLMMPGEDLISQIWIEELKDYFFIPVSGTCMAASLMTGQIACLLERHIQKKNLKTFIIKKLRIKKLISQNKSNYRV
jgi:hypothetical protein